MKLPLFCFILIFFIDNSLQNSLNFTSETRIFGGKSAKSKQFPYQVGLCLFPEASAAVCSQSCRTCWCGGTLISNEFILTAAHCLVDKTTRQLGHFLGIILGGVDKNNLQEIGQRRYLVTSDHFLVHEGYNIDTLENDIALVKLPEPVQFDDYVQAVKLPPLDSLTKKYIGTTVISSGWGRTSDDVNAYPNVLQYMTSKIQLHKYCIESFSEYVPKSQMCLNVAKKSLCLGDSGGPHISKNSKGEKIIIGITSYGSTKGCTLGVPQVLTRVSYYLNWISKNTGISIDH